LFDIQGILLLAKGKPITLGIQELLQKRQIYTLQYELDQSQAPNRTQKFSESEYQDIVGYVREVFEDTCIISVSHLEKTFCIVDRIINELAGNSQVLSRSKQIPRI